MAGVSEPMRVTHVSGAGAAMAALQSATQQGTATVAPPLKQGFLHKRGNKPYIKTLKQRWFVLEDHTLTYHKKPGMPALGTIPMAEVTSIASVESPTDPFLFALTHERGDSQRIYYLRARSLPEMEEWMDALRRSCAFHSSSSPAVGLAAATALNAALASSSASSSSSPSPSPSAPVPALLSAPMTPASATTAPASRFAAPPGLLSSSPPAGLASSTDGDWSSSVSSSTASSPATSDRYSGPPADGSSDLLQRYQTREIEVKELEKAFRETKEALAAEKRKVQFVLEKEQKTIENLQQDKNLLKAQLQKLERVLADREQSVLSNASAAGNPSVRYSTILGRDEEVMQLREEIQEKQEAFDALKKEMDTYKRMQTLFEKAGDSADPAQTIEVMKLQMTEMRELLEGKVHELQSKLMEEKKKADSDVSQWKTMAQKELKARLQLESEKAALQKELQESKRLSQSISTASLEQMEIEEKDAVMVGSRRTSGKWRSSRSTAYQEPLLDDGEPEDGDVSIWTPTKRGNPQASAACTNCTLQ